MLFRYIGDYPPGQTALVCFGKYSFTYGAAIDLPEPFATKARGNPFFQVADPVAVPAAADAPPAESKPEAQLPQTKAELIAIAEANNIDIDKRWGFDRIAQTIIAHSKTSG